MNDPIRVLYIEDNPVDARLLKEELQMADSSRMVRLESVDRLELGLERLADNEIQAVLLDLSLPDSQGLESLQRVLSAAPQLPVIVITGRSDEETGIQALKAGAQDYLVKSQVSGGLLVRVIQHALQRKQTEIALRESEQRFRLVVQSAPIAIISVNAEGRIDLANTQSERLFGYSTNELIGQPIEVLVPRMLRDGHRHLLQKYMTEPQTISLNLRHPLVGMHRDGIEIPMEIGLAPYQSSDGLHILALINDITERKYAVDALRQREALLDKSQAMAHVGSWELDPTSSRMLWSDEVYRIFGMGVQELEPNYEAFLHAVHPQDRPAVHEAYSGSASERRDGCEIEHRIIRRDTGEIRYVYEKCEHERDSSGRILRSVGMMQDITERKKAEDSLQEREARLKAVVENVGGTLWSIDSGYRLTMFNSTYAQDLHAAAGHESRLGEILPPGWLPTGEREAWKARYDRALQGEAFQEEVMVELPAGNRLYREYSFTPILEADGRVIGITCLGRDITGRKLAEAELGASEERFRLLFENNQTAMLLIEPVSGSIHSANHAAAEFYGYPLSVLCTMNINEINQLTPDEVYAERMRALREERNYFNFQHRLSNGEIRAVEVHSAPVEVEGKTLLFSIVHDITDRKLAEEKFRRHINYLIGLREVDQAIASSFDVRLSLKILTSRAVSLLEVDAAAVLRLDPISNSLEYAAGHGFWTDMAHAADIRLVESIAGRAVIERRMVHIPSLADEPGDSAFSVLLREEKFACYYGLPLLVKGKVLGVLEVFHRSPLDQDQEWLDFLNTLAGQAAIAIDNARLWEQVQRHARDLELRVAERTAELNRINRELEHASRVKDEFLANMSHEFRTPLNSILGLSESLQEGLRGPLNEYQQNSLQIIQSSGRHLLELVNDILDLSKIEAGKFDFYPQQVSINDLCRSSLAFIKAQAVKKSIRVAYVNNAAVAEILVDPRRLKQILVNLLTNAVKFTPEGGQVDLQVDTDAELDLVRFTVKDTGIGIAPADLPNLFRPFVQVDSSLNRRHEGTGLGLALVQRLTDLHGGSVTVESELGRGSQFTIDLPWVREAAPARGGSEAPVEASVMVDRVDPSIKDNADRKTILLAEDNMANILTIGEYLESHGHTVIVAHDGLEAIEKAREASPDVILMDIQMPVLNGLDAIARLRGDQRFGATPVIALTALAMPGDRERCLAAGADEYMSKPVSLKKLLHSILKLTGRRDDQISEGKSE